VDATSPKSRPPHQRNSILCPSCRKLISRDEPRCPYCGTARPGSRLKSNPWALAAGDGRKAVNLIIAVNVLMYASAIIVDPARIGLSPNPLTFLSPSGSALELLGATGTVPVYHFHRYWTLVAASYLHGGILHIFFNMIALRQLAVMVNREFGVYRMFSIYSLAGVVGYLISCLFGVYWTIGASASICGLLGAILYYGKSRGGVYGRALVRQAAGWVVFLFVFGLLVPGINNWAHGGGIVSGIVGGWILGYKERQKEALFHKMLALAFAAVTLGVLFRAVGMAVYYRWFQHAL